MTVRPPLSDLRILLATWFGSGYLPKAPGTFGTMAAMPFGYLISVHFGTSILIASTIAITLIGISVSNVYMAQSGEHDPGPVVIDEVAGVWLTMVPVAMNPTWQAMIAAFLLFRLFDIVKPWPISLADRKIKGGLGVMVDDLLAGIAAAVCLYGIVYWMPSVIGWE